MRLKENFICASNQSAYTVNGLLSQQRTLNGLRQQQKRNYRVPRIRTVKPEFWSHPVMGRQKDDVKTMGIALLNYADDEGYFYADPASIRSFARPFDDQSTTTLVCLQQLMKIEYIEICLHPVRGYVGKVINFLDHQRIDRPKGSVIKKFFDVAIPTINLGCVGDESTIDRAGKERKGKEQEEQKPSARKTRGAGVNNSQVSKAAGETRHSRLMEATKQWFKEWAGTDCPWDGGEGRQLSALLSAWPGGSDADFFRCLENIEKSDCIPPGTRPCKWLHDLLKFIKGPLDGFWKLKQVKNGNGNYQSIGAKRDAANVEALVRSGMGAKVQHVHADPGAAVQDRVDDSDRKSKATFAGN
jgi:hypothetical protein